MSNDHTVVVDVIHPIFVPMSERVLLSGRRPKHFQPRVVVTLTLLFLNALFLHWPNDKYNNQPNCHK